MRVRPKLFRMYSDIEYDSQYIPSPPQSQYDSDLTSDPSSDSDSDADPDHYDHPLDHFLPHRLVSYILTYIAPRRPPPYPLYWNHPPAAEGCGPLFAAFLCDLWPLALHASWPMPALRCIASHLFRTP